MNVDDALQLREALEHFAAEHSVPNTTWAKELYMFHGAPVPNRTRRIGCELKCWTWGEYRYKYELGFFGIEKF